MREGYGEGEAGGRDKREEQLVEHPDALLRFSEAFEGLRKREKALWASRAALYEGEGKGSV